MKRLLFLCWASVALAQTPTPPPAAPAPLDPLLAPPSVWESPKFVETNQALNFRWLSTAHDSAQSTLKNATFFGKPVCQTLVHFDQGKPKEITALFYNRGDRGEIGRAPYETLIKELIEAISAATKTAFVPRGRDATNAVKVDGVVWKTPGATYLLEYSCTKTPQVPFRAEFVRLRISPVEKPKPLLERSFAESKKELFNGPKHVTRDTVSGDVVIKDIPMVDQGEKGYCVVATAERVLRYYGIKVDENELAQLANTSADKGTSVRAMTESLAKLTARLRIRVRMIYEIHLNTLIADYDQVARRTKGLAIDHTFKDSSDLYAQMKPDVLREARAKDRTGINIFARHVQSHIDAGIPILWSVMLGVLPNDSKSSLPAGLMRLIIGYNAQTDEVLFSDPWGFGHELKRMPTNDAWTITTYIGTIEPL
ncbi:MAG: C39 family peptidase [Verrucomicrobia bacterium]|nr:C39 family peptidase [Verrucomicrobiota bacterium]